MKIGVFTHPLDYNYGCLLQAFALQTTLKRFGHEVITINRFTDTSEPLLQHIRSWLYRLYSKFFRGRSVSILWNPNLSLKDIELLSKNTSRFVKRNIVNTGPVFVKNLPMVDEKYKFDAYVVGSDQVWLPHFCPASFLDFVKRPGVKKMFYAASAGRHSFADFPALVPICKDLVKSFSGVSVRETGLIQVAKDYLDVEAEQVLDPTLLLDSTDYLNACTEQDCGTPVIFTYILDKSGEKKKIVEAIKNKFNLEVVSGTVEHDYRKGCGMKIEDCIYPSVDYWIHNLNRARFVVTDSFHGSCMSIVFRKPFVVIGNVGRGVERMKSLLQLFEMEDRLIFNASDLKDNELDEELDNPRINKILQEQKEKSLTFINTHLS